MSFAEQPEKFEQWMARNPPRSAVPREDLRKMLAIAETAPAGDFIEVGVWGGGSAQLLYWLAAEQGRKLWLYDTFEGIPFADPIDEHEPGCYRGMSADQAQAMFPGAIVQKGIFPGKFFMPSRIAFVHLDVDQYRSYREALDFLLPLMTPGGIILCDDYCLAGAKKAIDETLGNKEILPNQRAVFRC